jgi:purine-binding chemotaxis protein CheW
MEEEKKAATDAHERLTGDVKQYLTFRLNQEVFAVEVFRVREVLEVVNITRVPNAPSYMRGMINVRGSVVPVMDTRHKFGMGEVEATLDTRIIILEVKDLDGEIIVMGALADSVHEVTELNADDVESAPHLGTNWDTHFIAGIAKRNDQFIIILDIDYVFTSTELTALSDVHDSNEEHQLQGTSLSEEQATN